MEAVFRTKGQNTSRFPISLRKPGLNMTQVRMLDNKCHLIHTKRSNPRHGTRLIYPVSLCLELMIPSHFQKTL